MKSGADVAFRLTLHSSLFIQYSVPTLSHQGANCLRYFAFFHFWQEGKKGGVVKIRGT